MSANLKYTQTADHADLNVVFTDTSLVDMEYLKFLDIPSPTNYYLSTSGVPIPEKSRNLEHDYQAMWNPNLSSIYALESVNVDGMDGIQIYEVLQSGHRLNYSNRNEVISQLNEFIYSDIGYDMYPSYGVDGPITQLMDFPLSPAADIPQAYFLALSGSEDDVQAYLNERGITHFNAKHIIWLNVQSKFFYLSRFYGVPSLTPKLTVLENSLYSTAKDNIMVKDIIPKIEQYMYLYDKDPKSFIAYFDRLINHPAMVEQSLGITYLPRMYNSYYEYYALRFRNPAELPKNYNLTLSTYRQYLSMLSDKELIQYIGYLPDKYDYRKDLQQAYINLYDGTNIILASHTLCTEDSRLNLFTLDPYNEHVIGIGNVKHGFSCISLDELLEYIQANDGQLRNPRTTAGLSIPEVERIQELYSIIYPADEPRLLRLGKYISLALASQVENDRFITEFQQSINPTNKQAAMDIFYRLFYMGMYFRQWLGPGHVFPLVESQTGNEASPGSCMDTYITTKVFEQSQLLDEDLRKVSESTKQAFWKLPIKTIDYDKKIINTGRNIASRYHEVIIQPTDADSSCLRVASSQFIATGAFYLARLFGETIPGYTLNQRVEHVQ